MSPRLHLIRSTTTTATASTRTRRINPTLLLTSSKSLRGSHSPRTNVGPTTRSFSSTDIFPDEPMGPVVKTEMVPGPRGLEMVSNVFDVGFQRRVGFYLAWMGRRLI